MATIYPQTTLITEQYPRVSMVPTIPEHTYGNYLFKTLAKNAKQVSENLLFPPLLLLPTKLTLHLERSGCNSSLSAMLKDTFPLGLADATFLITPAISS